jgi:hypothetical protein
MPIICLAKPQQIVILNKMITNVCCFENFTPKLIWTDYSNLFYLDVESGTISNATLSNVHFYFESAAQDLSLDLIN